MQYRGIILTGTSGSGKSTLANEFCTTESPFLRVKAVTTRSRRLDDRFDEYDYISKDDFRQLQDSNALFINAEYRGEFYGIRYIDIQSVEQAGKVPILLLTPLSAKKINTNRSRYGSINKLDLPFLSIFIDASDEALDKRSRIRGRAEQSIPAMLLQRNIDRESKYDFVYAIENEELDISIDLIRSLWIYVDVGGVLSARLLALMIRCKVLLVDAKIENIAGASYDLSLGDEYFYGGRIHYLDEKNPFLHIEPYDYAIVTSREIANFPSNIVARFDLSVSLFCQGIILSAGPQVDPGFRGKIFSLLFNTSSSPVLLKRGQHYTTIEFNKLIEPTLPYKGRYQNKNLIDYLPNNATQGAINELKKELEQVRAENRQLQGNTIAVLSLVLAIAAVLIALA